MRRFTRVQRQSKESSKELAALCKRAPSSASFEAVKKCIDSGADPHYRDESSMPMPILHTFIEAGNVEAVKACLTTPKRIDFTLTDKRCRKTPLHCLCQIPLSDEKTAAILTLIVDRLEKHKDDMIRWVQEDDEGADFLCCAAKNQQLALVWSIVRDIPFFADQNEPLTLLKVWEWDWNALGKEEQVCFSLAEGNCIRANQHTGRLSKLFLRGNPDPKKVEAFVSKGADIFFPVDALHSPIFHMFVWYGFVECVRACLTTPSPIDFSIKDGAGYTALHCLCFGENPPEVVVKIMHLILDRLEKRAPHYFYSSSPPATPTTPATSSFSSSVVSLPPLVSASSFSVDPTSTGGSNNSSNSHYSHGNHHHHNNNNNVNANATITGTLSDRENYSTVNSQIDLRRQGGGSTPTIIMDTGRQPQQKKRVRIESMEREATNHTEDSIDWEAKSDAGHSFISTAAGNGILSVVWPVLKQRRVKHFVCHTDGPIPITCEMFKEDYYNIATEDRALFSTRPFFKS